MPEHDDNNGGGSQYLLRQLVSLVSAIPDLSRGLDRNSAKRLDELAAEMRLAFQHLDEEVVALSGAIEQNHRAIERLATASHRVTGSHRLAEPADLAPAASATRQPPPLPPALPPAPHVVPPPPVPAHVPREASGDVLLRRRHVAAVLPWVVRLAPWALAAASAVFAGTRCEAPIGRLQKLSERAPDMAVRVERPAADHAHE